MCVYLCVCVCVCVCVRGGGGGQERKPGGLDVPIRGKYKNMKETEGHVWCKTGDWVNFTP